MNAVAIRPAELADADAVFALLRQFATSYRPERTIFDHNFPVLIGSTDAYLPVAVTGGEVVAYAFAFRLLTLFANGPVFELQELMVAPEFRGRGIGRLVVGQIIEHARLAGASEVTVPTRRAARFYVANGFEETATYFKRSVGNRSA